MKSSFTFLTNADPSYIEGLYQQFLQHPDTLDPGWKAFFQGYHLHKLEETKHRDLGQHQKLDTDEISVALLIEGYRNRAHLISDTNPIRKRKNRVPRLELEDFNLDSSKLNLPYAAGKMIGLPGATLQEIVQKLKSIYCNKIGFEIQHITHQEKRNWLIHKIENARPDLHYHLSLDEKKRILEKLNGAAIFEKFLHTKYVGQKRFSLEGGECTIPALDAIVDWSSLHGTQEVIIGMAHRGRLNVLANVVGKTYDQIFNEFEGTAVPDLSFGSGDVKYHLGYSSQITCPNGKMVYIKLAPNPSHLEAVDPVVMGISRAKSDLLYQSDYDKILPILIHGDAAIAGQGVVYENVQMSKLDGYYTGGTIHFVINNQIGFTTDFDDARSSTYCTAAAHLVEAPVFHVNGDDPEAVVFVSRLAAEFRQTFNEDVFIDMVCYRKHGHNEGDDPKFTQPQLYEIINSHQGVRESYIQKLTERGDIEAELAKNMELSFWSHLQERLNLVKENPLPYKYQEPELAWKALKKVQLASDFVNYPDTGIELSTLKDLFLSTLELPEGFKALPKIEKLYKVWKENLNASSVDWSMAEMMAYGSLLWEKKNVRISGQDVKRGTFSHRHAIVRDLVTDIPHNRLSRISQHQGKFFIYNSLLSEFAVLGFEYGYSLGSPDHLVIWEAQFGDFSNGAQVIIDQFIATAQSKWNRMSGIVLLLPHGYDGQGPEHSSARLERFLQSCAECNIIVANVTTPANYFHLIRRQLHFEFRKPLVVMSPKSLLRNPFCISDLSSFGPNTRFLDTIIDKTDQPMDKINKIILCSGQIFYDLKKWQQEYTIHDAVLVRVEQLYPFPIQSIHAIRQKYNAKHWVWVQEEPQNMGAATYLKQQLADFNLHIISRPPSAAPAVGYKKIHDQQLNNILQSAFN